METSRLRLRCVRHEDAPAIARMMTDPVSRRLASWPVPYTLEMAERRIADARSQFADRRLLPLILERRGLPEPIGWISAARAEAEPEVAYLTYWLGEAHHGQGLMREAAPVAVEAAFRELGVSRLRAAVQPDNTASLAVVRRLGAALLCLGKIYVPARDVEEDCFYWELQRPAALPPFVSLPAADVAVVSDATG